jgi:hypothetical protein
MNDTSITYQIDNLLTDGPAPLYHRYPSQTTEQRAYVELDENGTVTADWDGEIGGGVPSHVWHGRTRRYSVPSNVSGRALAGLLRSERVLSLLERVYEGLEIVWDGSNHVGRLTDDACEADSELADAIDEVGKYEEYRCEVWTASEWLFTSGTLADAWPAGVSLDDAVSNLKVEAKFNRIHIDGSIRQALLDRAARDFADDPDSITAEQREALEE